MNEQIPIEMLAKCSAHKVKSHRVGAAVGKRHAEADDAQHMPEHVVILLCSGPAERREKESERDGMGKRTEVYVNLKET